MRALSGLKVCAIIKEVLRGSLGWFLAILKPLVGLESENISSDCILMKNSKSRKLSKFLKALKAQKALKAPKLP